MVVVGSSNSSSSNSINNSSVIKKSKSQLNNKRRRKRRIAKKNHSLSRGGGRQTMIHLNSLAVIMTTAMTMILLTALLSAQVTSAALRGGTKSNSTKTSWASKVKKSRDSSRSLDIINHSKSNVEIYWIHPQTDEHVLTSSPFLLPGGDMPINSYTGHRFQAKELPNKRTGHCKSPDGECRTTYFVVTDNDEQRVTITKKFDAVFFDSKIHAQKETNGMIDRCRSLLKKREKKDSSYSWKEMELMVECVKNDVTDVLEEKHEEINFQSSVRVHIAEKLENYTCDDSTMESSTPLRTEQWLQYPPSPETGGSIFSGLSSLGLSKNQQHKPRALSRNVHIMHDRPTSRIHVIDNFVLQDECDAMQKSASKKLHKATVADGKGGSQFSEARKAMQAGIHVPWHLEKTQDNPIARLSRRVYDYTNHVLGLNIEEHGQEDLMSIQYQGAGRDSNDPPDRYMPHCDGDCAGSPHKPGTRMATMVMYCVVPTDGGHTNFRNAGVHVKPNPGTAVFFSYIDPETLISDNGFTTHSGCPVYEGRKEIVTQWIRRGVDKENPWDSFNTLGISTKKLESDDDEFDFDDGEDL